MDTISKAVDPGKSKDEMKWPDWEAAFVSKQSTIPGISGVLLSYVVHTKDNPDHNTDFEDDFVAWSIACAPLNGASFHADACKVHQLLMNFLVAESAEHRIKDISNHVNGQLDVQSLCNPYDGEGNVSRQIATVEKLHETLHYKSEQTLPS